MYEETFLGSPGGTGTAGPGWPRVDSTVTDWPTPFPISRSLVAARHPRLPARLLVSHPGRRVAQEVVSPPPSSSAGRRLAAS